MYQDRIGIKTPEYVSLNFQLAGLGSRTAAYIIDQAILTIVNILIVFILFLILSGQSDLLLWAELNSVPVAIAIILLFILNWGYFFAFEYFSGGRTIGKKVLGLRVIQEDGHSITLLSSFIRNFLRIIDSLPANYVLGMMMIFFHSKHKRIGDLVAGTIVVHERKTKKQKKLTPIEKEIEKRGLAKNDLFLEEQVLKTFGVKDWNLVKTYCSRFLHLSEEESIRLTRQIGEIVLPKAGLDTTGKSFQDLENILLVLYLHLRDEWEYEL
ncbi:RDD family protein [Bacillus sp. DTU_2020_1000418_1_SI_GHA_SEK_038]|uniref:RDD family protein n=1 Tax=Bacillus sp. DTU_2020_1000418_1_SI_GHA_SEK_038 TaxID=3077585 RepID=UPI0028EBC731|nr:RDD family protein [Bacillus sp. DTU_2020_1000418_1_SI_GHA_SEK_038]WNS77464.1 RDD family protein [Bacillus sp. DTU_2020_1000418_1_SI_GHA_SEK_038]